MIKPFFIIATFTLGVSPLAQADIIAQLDNASLT
jgi:hypothetical protein